MSKKKLSSSGGVVSSVKLATGTLFSGMTDITGLKKTSRIVCAVIARKVLFRSVARPVNLLMEFRSVLVSTAITTYPSVLGVLPPVRVYWLTVSEGSRLARNVICSYAMRPLSTMSLKNKVSLPLFTSREKSVNCGPVLSVM